MITFVDSDFSPFQKIGVLVKDSCIELLHVLAESAQTAVELSPTLGGGEQSKTKGCVNVISAELVAEISGGIDMAMDGTIPEVAPAENTGAGKQLCQPEVYY